MSTHYSFHHARHHRHIRHLKRLLGLLLILVLLVGLWFGFQFFGRTGEDMQPAVSTPRVQPQQITTKLFRTPYFEFQTSSDWLEDGNLTKNNTFVYRAYDDSLIEQDLTIYVEPAFSRPEATYVQPVTISSSGKLATVGGISNHCRQSVPAGTKDNRVVVHQGVEVNCDSDGTLFIVLVGVEGGNSTMVLPRPDGTMIRITILYRDLTASPVGRDISQILNSFRTL